MYRLYWTVLSHLCVICVGCCLCLLDVTVAITSEAHCYYASHIDLHIRGNYANMYVRLRLYAPFALISLTQVDYAHIRGELLERADRRSVSTTWSCKATCQWANEHSVHVHMRCEQETISNMRANWWRALGIRQIVQSTGTLQFSLMHRQQRNCDIIPKNVYTLNILWSYEQWLAQSCI